MKSVRRDGRKNDNPGPGAYSVRPVTVHIQKAPSFGFGSAHRDCLRPSRAQTSEPSSRRTARDRATPQHMGQLSVFGDVVASKRSEAVRVAGVPGPGAYQPADQTLSVVESRPKWGFGSSPRDRRCVATAPGPGSYTEPATSCGLKFSFRCRPHTPRKDETPGPGAHIGFYTQFTESK